MTRRWFKNMVSPQRCQNPNCGRTLKNKKRYTVLGIVPIKGSKSTEFAEALVKQCKKCLHLSVGRPQFASSISLDDMIPW